MNVETDQVPPVPRHTPPVDEKDIQKRFRIDWQQWFEILRSKVNVIDRTLASISQLLGGGIVVVDDGQAVQRTIDGTSGRIVVTNGNGIAGNPTIDLDVSGVTPGSYTLVALTVDSFGRITSISSGSIDAEDIPITPIPGVTGTNVQEALDDLAARVAALE